MILAWIISLLLLLSTLVIHLERMTSLRIIELNTMKQAQGDFINSEKAVLECEEHLTSLAVLKENPCFIQAVGNHRWLISSKAKPVIQIGVVVDEKTGTTTRVNWRQVFE